MFSESVLQFLRTHQEAILVRWRDLCEQDLPPDFVAGGWFTNDFLQTTFEQILEACQKRVYRNLNRTIETLTRLDTTPSPLDVKAFLLLCPTAAQQVMVDLGDQVRSAAEVGEGLRTIGDTLKRVYSERLSPVLLRTIDEHAEQLRTDWLRDLPTPRVSDQFALLSPEDRAAFVQATYDVYLSVLRGRDEELVPHPQLPQTPITKVEAWIARQVDYFSPKGFRVIDLMRAVGHFAMLLEPYLARATGDDAWTYRISRGLLDDARQVLVRNLTDAFVQRFSKDFYSEVGIMLHRIKNKLTSVPTTMRTVLAIEDEQYGRLFDPMVLTVDEAALWSDYDILRQAVVEAAAAVAEGDPVAGSDASAEALTQLSQAHQALREFLETHQETIDTIRTMKLDPSATEMLLEMLGIVFEGGVQTENLALDLQVRMNELYERETPKWEPLAIRDIVGAAVSEAEVDARAKNIQFTADLDAEGVRIYGVRRELSRPFIQMIDNAIKYTPEKGKVDVSLARDGDQHVVFRVQDTGIGIPPGEMEEVFSLCERCSNAKDFASGTGTGLYHDRITIRHHNGDMWAESEGVGKGSTFYIRLPIYHEPGD